MKFLLSVLQRDAAGVHKVRQIGDFALLEDAIAAARREVDAMLGGLYVPGMTSTQLVDSYRGSGQTPYISRDDEETMNAKSFNHFQYARSRSKTLCGEDGSAG
jgi:hypothetical protein